MEGYIHSIESFGTVDGPGVRFVVFLRGCPMRCLYCHNPDTWDRAGSLRMSPEELMAQYRKNRPFYQNGGITVTGGEPLGQVAFLCELFRLAKAEGVHTCIDTSGVTYRPEASAYRRRLDALMALTDLVLLDLKHMDREEHRRLTGQANDGILGFATYLEEREIPVWIRHVLVPGITDSEEHLLCLGRFVGGLSNVKALEVLPYHTMGVEKYRGMGLPYPLEGVPPATDRQAARAREIILRGVRERREDMSRGGAAEQTVCPAE